jgi:hypothetical protein
MYSLIGQELNISAKSLEHQILLFTRTAGVGIDKSEIHLGFSSIYMLSFHEYLIYRPGEEDKDETTRLGSFSIHDIDSNHCKIEDVYPPEQDDPEHPLSPKRQARREKMREFLIQLEKQLVSKIKLIDEAQELPTPVIQEGAAGPKNPEALAIDHTPSDEFDCAKYLPRTKATQETYKHIYKKYLEYLQIQLDLWENDEREKPKKKMEEFQTHLIKELGTTISTRTLYTILQLGKAGCLE